MKKLALLAACAMARGPAPHGARRDLGHRARHPDRRDRPRAPGRHDRHRRRRQDRQRRPQRARQAPKGKVIDGRGKYLMPGLMDVHIHLHGGVDQQDRHQREPHRQALASYLYSGVTTIYDAGNQADNILPLRAAERAGKIAQPPHLRHRQPDHLSGQPRHGHGGEHPGLREGQGQARPHIAEQQPDVVKLTLEEEGWGARPMITADARAAAARPDPLLQSARHPHDDPRLVASCAPRRRSSPGPTAWPTR